MSPRPFHRWKSFWLGLLVLIFLGWAWVRSTHHIDDISYKASSSSRTWVVSTGFGALLLGWADDPFAPDGPEVSSYAVDRTWVTNGWFPKPITLEGDRPEGWQSFSIAHWFLILLFLVPWAGFHFWRVRRMRRVGEMRPSVEKGVLS